MVVAVIGLLGFVFWQNFIDKQSDKSKDATSSQSETKDSDKKVISEWGVKGNIAGLENATYTIKEGGYLWFTTKTLPEACTSNTGYIVRLTANQEIPDIFNPGPTAKEEYAKSTEGAAHVGEYYYFYQGPTAPAVCWGEDDDEDAVLAEIDSLNNTLIKFVESLTKE